jgi:signal transduction histidine kinase
VGPVGAIDQGEELIVKRAAGLAAATGIEFLQGLVAYLAVELHADRARVAILTSDSPRRAVILATFPDSQDADRCAYDLAGTPEDNLPDCGSIAHQSLGDGKKWSGVLLAGSSGEAVGVLSVSYRSGRSAAHEVEAALSRFAPRAAAEIERQHDLSHGKREERRMQERNAELERQLTERTTQLAAVNQELEAFSYSISHDLRAAIQGILACSRIVVEDHGDKLGETGTLWLNHVSEDAAKLDTLTMALLDLSLVSRANLSRGSVDLSAMAESIGQRLSSSDPVRKGNFRVAPGLTVSADAALLGGVMDHLLGNAWKFTKTRELAEIEVGVEVTAGEPVYFVRDNGVGFNMRYAEKLFGAFQRLHRAEDFEGNGIGLATVRRVIHRHGGRVWADAKVNGGATFFFTLGRSEGA